MKYVLLDKDNIVISIGDKLEETDESFKIDNTIFYKEEGFHCEEVEKVGSKVEVLKYKYEGGKFKRIDSLFSIFKKRKGL